MNRNCNSLNLTTLLHHDILILTTKESGDFMFDGKKLKAIRESKKLTRIELSKLADVPLRTLEDWEAERVEIKKMDHLGNIAKILDCSVFDICKDEVLLNDKKFRKTRDMLKNTLSIEEQLFIETLLLEYLKHPLNDSDRVLAGNILYRLK